MIEIEIDGQTLQVSEGDSIIEAADAAGIYIPRFCYHKKLSVAANCRMCLVEVDKVGKPLPACATPVTPNMKVMTKSKKAMDAQRAVMEFLLINHPLDCPICDQGGVCELQDLAMGYGAPASKYDEKKRAVFSEDIGPLIETEMTRCIHCTRCVRFGEEIANLPELGIVNRGGHAEITTYVKHFMESELSGNIIDLCPVGALTAKPSRYSVRGWEAIEHPMIAPHDCVGTNIFVHTKGREYFKERLVMQVVPRENTTINEVWMSDRDRFSYEGINHEERSRVPLLRQDHRFTEMDWDTILEDLAGRLNAIISEKGPDELAVLVSPNATVEECFLLQTWLRQLGSNNIDFRLRERDFSDQTTMNSYLGLSYSIESIETLSSILLVGSNVRFEQPMIAHRMNKAVVEGARVFAINPIDYRFTFQTAAKLITADIIDGLEKLIQAIECGEGEPSLLAMAAGLKESASGSGIFIGSFALNHPHASYIRMQVKKIAELTGAKINFLPEGANSAGAYLAGAIPHRGPAGASVPGKFGLNAKELLVDEPVSAYILLGFEPEFDTAFPAETLKNLEKADLVVSLTPFVSDRMKQYSHMILPIAPFTENEGTFVNAVGTWQSFTAANPPTHKVKPAWQVIRAIARAMKLNGFDYQFVTDIRDELSNKVKSMTVTPEAPVSGEMKVRPTLPGTLIRVGSYPAYAVDSIVRRAKSLQEVMGAVAVISVNPQDAARLGFQEGDSVLAKQSYSELALPLKLDARLPEGIVLIPAGISETAGFGDIFGAVELRKEVL